MIIFGKPGTGARNLDIETEAMRSHRIWVRDDCDGSPSCVVEIHVEETARHAEVHLNYAECKALRKVLRQAMRKNKNADNPVRDDD